MHGTNDWTMDVAPEHDREADDTAAAEKPSPDCRGCGLDNTGMLDADNTCYCGADS